MIAPLPVAWLVRRAPWPGAEQFWRRARRWTSRHAPEAFHRRYGELCRAAGATGLQVVLSFDCDTEKDIAVAGDVNAWLAARGVPAVYAVPGELLAAGREVYSAVHRSGAEFLNHGFLTHTRLVDDAYVSTLFYDQLDRGAVLRDIELGHAAVRETLGVAPRGFRVPHFATFQEPAQLAFLHATLAGLGYAYSTSTMPAFGFRYGPVRNAGGVLEFPVSGSFNLPLIPLDSYGVRFAPDRPFGAGDYVGQVRRLATFYLREGLPAVLGFYVDPSQVYNFPEFFEAVEALRGLGGAVRFSTYADLLASPLCARSAR